MDKIKLIEDANVETLKRLLAGLDIDQFIPCVRMPDGTIRFMTEMTLVGNCVVFE